MKPFHSSYSNLGSWKTSFDPQTGVFKVMHNFTTTIIGALIVGVIAVGFGVSVYYYSSFDEKVIFLVIGIMIGLIVPFVMIANGYNEREKGCVIIYDTKNDQIEVPRLGISATKASEYIKFSYEHYPSSSGGNFELNVVKEGERLGFLSHSNISGLEPIVEGLESQGFVVQKHKVN